MPDDIEVRDARAQDGAAIRGLNDVTHAIHRARFPHAFDPDNAAMHNLLDIALAPDPLQGRLKSRLRVAFRGEVMLGYALVVWMAPSSSGDDNSANIADIAVAKGVQRQGVARALLADLEQMRREHGWGSLTADVWDGNDASHALFRAAGFDTEVTHYRLGKPPAMRAATDDPPQRRWMFWAALLVAFIVIALVQARFS